MARKPGDTSHYRTRAGAPMTSLGTIYERVMPDGKRHPFGFVRGVKLIAFPTEERSTGGDLKWNLFSQALSADGEADLGARLAIEARAAAPQAPTLKADRLPFASGLSDSFRARRR
jgi:hypothetical protein